LDKKLFCGDEAGKTQNGERERNKDIPMIWNGN